MGADYYGAFLAVTRELNETKERYESLLAERDDLIYTLRADVATLGAQVKQVNIEAGGNTTTNRILSPGDGLPSDVGAATVEDFTPPPTVPLWAKLLALLGLGWALYKLKR